MSAVIRLKITHKAHLTGRHVDGLPSCVGEGPGYRL